ncbi:MAG: hypothetical protein V4591_12495 [Bdellovibrionota bacterium]
MSEEDSKKIPESVKVKIENLKKLETLLGHLPCDNWTVSELQKRTEDSTHQHSLAQMEAQTEILFTEICEDLVEHKYNYSEIAHSVNGILASPTGMKYCNEVEVREALGIE